ncbi:MAG: hypothetical protein PHS88_08130 [Candidatus Omnitrophica bacterium]|nr:hypothetical protein [Candidatus Omnitrophota bacterium]
MRGPIKITGRFMVFSFFVAAISPWMICPIATAESEREFRQSEISQPLIPNELARAVVNLEGLQIAQAVGGTNELIQIPEPVLVQAVTEILQGQGRMTPPDGQAVQKSEGPIPATLSQDGKFAGDMQPIPMMKNNVLGENLAQRFVGTENIFPAGEKHETIPAGRILPVVEMERAILGQPSAQAIGRDVEIGVATTHRQMQPAQSFATPAPMMIQEQPFVNAQSGEQTHAGTSDFGGPCGSIDDIIVESPSLEKEPSVVEVGGGSDEFQSMPGGAGDFIDPHVRDGEEPQNAPGPEVPGPSFNSSYVPVEDVMNDGVDLNFVAVSTGGEEPQNAPGPEVPGPSFNSSYVPVEDVLSDGVDLDFVEGPPAGGDPVKEEKAFAVSAEVVPIKIDLPVHEEGGNGDKLEADKMNG